MKVCVLISCMHQKDVSIIERSNVQTDVVVVNQCDRNSIEEFDFINKKGETCHAKFICTTERGLSKSRNMAIRYAENADICMICDDDERFEDDYEDKITEAYQELYQADVITFAYKKEIGTRKFSTRSHKLSFINILKTCSIQISFKRKSIITNNIWFDEKMGSGSGNGGGEENKFLLDCRKHKLKLYFNPNKILLIYHNPNSQWFSGYTPRFFENLGWTTRRLHGSIVSHSYYIYFILSHYHMFRSECTWYKAIKSLYKGYFSIR